MWGSVKNGYTLWGRHYQWRDSLYLPLVVCNHTYELSGDDRDRWSISLKDSNCAIREVFRKFNSSQALTVLELCRPCWKNTYDMSYLRRNWYGMLEILIDKVAGNDDTRNLFLNRYGEKIITTGFQWWMKKCKKEMAAEWFRKSPYHVIMETKESAFSYEWLTYVGVWQSTNLLSQP